MWAYLWIPNYACMHLQAADIITHFVAACCLHCFIKFSTFYLNYNLFLSKRVPAHLRRFFSRPLTFLCSHFMFLFFFFCRCFDWQDYCSRDWCLDTGWYFSAPWAHSQIREDIRNLSLHVLFNHPGWRGNMFMKLTVEPEYCLVCVNVVCAVTVLIEISWEILIKNDSIVSPEFEKLCLFGEWKKISREWRRGEEKPKIFWKS